MWGIRNFILSGIAKKLNEQYEIFYAVPESGKAYMLGIGISEEQLLILKVQKYSGLQLWCSLILREAHWRRFPTSSDAVFKSITKAGTKGIRAFIVDVAAVIFRIPFFYRLLERLEQRFFVKRIDVELESQIKAINPYFALSTSFVVNTEWPLFRLLHAYHVKIVTHILSFDNLTSRGYLPIKIFDKFLVWNAKMGNELTSIYNISTERITITGTPQFDFHVQQKHIQSREWLQAKLDLGMAPYIIYCANHHILTPDEPQLVQKILDAFQNNVTLRSYQFVLRLHPMDDYDRWDKLLTDYPFIRVSYPWSHANKKTLFWGEPSTEDLEIFSNTLRYCELVINIASTVSIDAAILDKPIVCVGFSSNSENKFSSLYYNFHYSDHYKPIMKTGATPLSTTLENLLALSVEGIENPLHLSEKRAQMVRLLCGDIDGKAADRVLDSLKG